MQIGYYYFRLFLVFISKLKLSIIQGRIFHLQINRAPRFSFSSPPPHLILPTLQPFCCLGVPLVRGWEGRGGENFNQSFYDLLVVLEKVCWKNFQVFDKVFLDNMSFFNLFDLSLSLLYLLAWIIESWLLSACVSFFSPSSF